MNQSPRPASPPKTPSDCSDNNDSKTSEHDGQNIENLQEILEKKLEENLNADDNLEKFKRVAIDYIDEKQLNYALMIALYLCLKNEDYNSDEHLSTACDIISAVVDNNNYFDWDILNECSAAIESMKNIIAQENTSCANNEKYLDRLKNLESQLDAIFKHPISSNTNISDDLQQKLNLILYHTICSADTDTKENPISQLDTILDLISDSNIDISDDLQQQLDTILNLILTSQNKISLQHKN